MAGYKWVIRVLIEFYVISKKDMNWIFYVGISCICVAPEFKKKCVLIFFVTLTEEVKRKLTAAYSKARDKAECDDLLTLLLIKVHWWSPWRHYDPLSKLLSLYSILESLVGQNDNGGKNVIENLLIDLVLNDF